MWHSLTTKKIEAENNLALEDGILDGGLRRNVQRWIPRPAPTSIDDLMYRAIEEGYEVTHIGEYKQGTVKDQFHQKSIPFIMIQIPWEVKNGHVLGRMFDISGISDLEGTLTDTSVEFTKRYVGKDHSPNKNAITYTGTSQGDGVYVGTWNFQSSEADMATTGTFRFRSLASAKALILTEVVGSRNDDDFIDYMRSGITEEDRARIEVEIVSKFSDGTFSANTEDGKWLIGSFINYHVSNDTYERIDALYRLLAVIEYEKSRRGKYFGMPLTGLVGKVASHLGKAPNFAHKAQQAIRENIIFPEVSAIVERYRNEFYRPPAPRIDSVFHDPHLTGLMGSAMREVVRENTK